MTGYCYQMTQTGAPFERVPMDLPTPGENEALVEVAGCGVCHTDISFSRLGVITRHDLPLTLGHEISGRVIVGPADIQGQSFIIPAVISCGKCSLCKSGRSNVCRAQQMPGNDFNGGFASHILVPSQQLAVVPDSALEQFALEELAVIADAVSTPYQVLLKSNLAAGDLAIVIGVGGIGVYAAQLAQAFGGKVIALDIDQTKLDRLAGVGINHTFNTRDVEIREIKKRVREMAATMGAPAHGWKIFEMTGTAGGQELGYALVGFAASLMIVGFTMDKIPIRLSNLMAFDATAIGTWGCRPELYPAVIELVVSGKIKISDFTQKFPLSTINDVFNQLLNHEISKRPVMVPDERYTA